MYYHRYNPKDLCANPCVSSVNDYTLVLATWFRIQLFQAWKKEGENGVSQLLEMNGLGPEKTGGKYANQVVLEFQNGGFPICRKSESYPENAPNPLLESGKFTLWNNGRGLQMSREFEEELFSNYPEIPVEMAISNAGLDPMDVGYQRIQRIKKTFEARSKGNCQAAGQKEPPALPRRPSYIEEAQNNPYVSVAGGSKVVLGEPFYNEASLLTGLGFERILEIYELREEWFEPRERNLAMAKLCRLDPGEGTAIAVTGDPGQMLRIARNRAKAMGQLVEDMFRCLRDALPGMDIDRRRELARWIHGLPRDPWKVYTTAGILSKIGLARSTYYELLNNEQYGMGARRRQGREDEDILRVRQVAEYKGYGKGYRQISMMMAHVTGRAMSENRVLYLMRKYGMRTGIRRPSKNRKAMKELMARNGKPDLLCRKFRLHRPNEVWLTDVTYLDYGDGQRAYGSASVDPVTGRLICFTVSDSNDLQLALDTLSAMDAYPAVNGGIIHSDQGILYFTDDFQSAVKDRDLIQSMSRRGNCWDNAPMESFFGHFKDESGYMECRDMGELRSKILDYSVYYNEERRMYDRGKMTPAEYEAYLNAMDDAAFADYMAREEEKYRKMKEKTAARAAGRAKARREAAEAILGEARNGI